MKKDLLLSLAVFCLTLIASFAMDHYQDYPGRKSIDVEKTKYRASSSETAQKDFVRRRKSDPVRR